jgi:type III secretion protein T
MADYIGYVEGFGFCTIRPAIALSLIPFGSKESLGVALRVPLMLLFATLPQLSRCPDNMAVAVMVEVLIGVTLGLLLGVVFHVAAAAGALIDQQVGYSIGTTYDPNFRDEAAIFEGLFGWFATLTFFTGKGLETVYGFFADAWVLWPPGAPRPDHMRVMHELAEQRLPMSLCEGAMIAMPFVALMLHVDIAVGLMSRYMKRLNPFTTARSVKVIVLSLTIVFSVPVLIERINAIFLQGAVLK